MRMSNGLRKENFVILVKRTKIAGRLKALEVL
jgi:hypothetical protein